MPLRETYGIDVDDASFNEFMRTFEKYRDVLDRMPGAWGKVNEKIGEARSEFADIAASMLSMMEMTNKSSREIERFERHAGGASRFISGMAREARDIAHHLGDATRSILRWTGVSTAAAGLLGFGSLWGLEHLGSSAGNLRRSSLGLGFAPGNAATMQAFQTNLGRLIDPGTFLGGVNTAMNDASMRWALNANGISGAQIQGGDTGSVGLSLLQNMWRELQNVPQGQLAQVMQARGMNQFMSLDAARRMQQTPYSELDNLISRTRSSGAGNRMSDQTLRDWQDFDTALKTAGNTLWDTVVRDLHPLTIPLTDLSAAFTKTVDAFLNAPWLKQWIDDAADGLKEFAGYVGTEAFKDQVKGFVEKVGALAKEVGTLVKDLEKLGLGIHRFFELVPWLAAPATGVTPATPSLGGIGGAFASGLGGYATMARGAWDWLTGGHHGGGGPRLPTHWPGHTLGGLFHPTSYTPGGDVSSIPMPADTGLRGTEMEINNFGGLRRPGIIAGPIGGGFQSFASQREGVQAAAHLLLIYQDRHHLNTLRGLINRWAPASDNGGASGFNRLLSGAASYTGYGLDQPLNLHDAATLSKVTEAFIRNEVGRKGPSQEMVNSVIAQYSNTANYASGPSKPASAGAGAGGLRVGGGLNLLASSAQPNVRIRIDNASGGNANVSAAQVATP